MQIDQKHKATLDKMIASNDPIYNFNKTIEEATELTEVLIKRIVKEGGPKSPSDDSIIEEIGDLYIRLEILSAKFGHTKVQDRINYKMSKYESYIKDNKYIGKI